LYNLYFVKIISDSIYVHTSMSIIAVLHK